MIYNRLDHALDASEFHKIFTCEITKEIWDRLKVTYEGTSQEIALRLDILVHSYELFSMVEKKSIRDMLNRFIEIMVSKV